MISLENVHKEMNSKIVQNIASVAFDKWHQDHRYQKNIDALLSFINSSFRGLRLVPTKHQKLAVEVVLMIKFENFMKEVTNLTGEQSLGQCDICLKFYQSEALDNCDSCEGTICIKCSVPDEEFDLVFCSECKD